MTTPAPFPGRPVRIGDDRRDVVSLVQARLEDMGCGPLLADGAFGPATRAAVQAFQVRRGLIPDGVIGPATWAVLFASPAGPQPVRAGRFAEALLKVAAGEVGVRESGGSNRGPRVDDYLRTVGLDPTRGSYSWCAAFVYFCFTRTSVTIGGRNPCLKTAGCMDHWRRAPAWARISASDVVSAPAVIPPGAVFIVDHGKGKGHTGLVERVSHASVHTIEGNTDPGGSREGDGVYRRIRPLAKINTGFIDYGRAEAG